MALKSLLICSTFFLISPAIKATEFFVSSVSEINTAMASAQPGDTLTMTNGRWTNANVDLRADGASGNPILIRAETPGLVILGGTSRLSIGGDWLVVDGLLFLGGSLSGDHVVRFRSGNGNANNSRLTNTVIDSYNPPNINTRYFWVSLYGRNNRVDHCYFTNQNHSGVTVVAWLDGVETNHRIDNNYFGNRPIGPDNGWETIRIGTSSESGTNAKVIVESNYFYKCDGEIEIISSKSNENVYRNNTFEECNGQLTLRHGKRNVIEGNFFLGNGVSGSSGVRVIDRDHIVRNNYFEGLNGTGFRAALSITNGVPNSPLNRYFQVINAEVSFNTFVDCVRPLEFGSGANSELSLPPLDCIVANNLVYSSQAQGNLIAYTDTPQNTIYEGNIMFGSPLGIPSEAGISEVDPLVVLGVDSLFRPASNSPVINAAVGSYPLVATDVDGQLRDANKDIGADEVSTLPITNRPLTAADVGPAWYPVATNVIQVPPGLNTLIDSIAIAGPFDEFELMPGVFEFDQTIFITQTVRIKAADSNQRPILRNIDAATTTRVLIEIQDGGRLYLDGIELDGMAGTATNAKYLIRTDPSPFTTPYILRANDCYFRDVVSGSDGNFFRAYAGTFADSLVFTNCLFENSGKEGIRAKDEVDDSEEYNVDIFEVVNCTFWNTNKEAIYIYAGDAAPFTDGPKILIDHSTFDACGDDDSRILYLRECDLAKVKNSLFTNSPNNRESIIMAGFGTVLSFSDTLNVGPVSLSRSGNLGNGMVSLDPLYFNRLGGDFTLAAGSPVNGLGDDGLPLGDQRWVDNLVGIDLIEQTTALPDGFSLSQNYPNPFNPSTSIQFSLSERATVSLTIYNTTGKLVETLVQNSLEPGSHSVKWQVSDHASGVYFYKLTVGGRSLTRKMMLLK